MKRRILALIAVLALVGVFIPAIVFATDTGTVTCTVSSIPVLVSVNVTDGNVTYGSLALGANITTIALNDTQTARNNGNVVEDFIIRSSNATRTAGTNWTLVSTPPGNNQFNHQVSVNQGSSWISMNVSPYFAMDVAVNGSQTFDLRITMPGSTTDYLEHTITVTIIAVQHS